jgi:hypothetical protein
MSEIYREHSNLKDEMPRLINSAKIELREEINAFNASFDDVKKKFIDLQVKIKE